MCGETEVQISPVIPSEGLGHVSRTFMIILYGIYLTQHYSGRKDILSVFCTDI